MRSYDSRRARAGNLANVEIRIPNDESMAECSNDDFRNAVKAADQALAAIRHSPHSVIRH
jgi:hypothetical protein